MDINHINRSFQGPEKFFKAQSLTTKTVVKHCPQRTCLWLWQPPKSLFVPNLPSPILNQSWTWGRRLAHGKSCLGSTKSAITQECEWSLVDNEVYLGQKLEPSKSYCWSPWNSFGSSPFWDPAVQLFLGFYDSYFLCTNLSSVILNRFLFSMLKRTLMPQNFSTVTEMVFPGVLTWDTKL